MPALQRHARRAGCRARAVVDWCVSVVDPNTLVEVLGRLIPEGRAGVHGCPRREACLIDNQILASRPSPA